MKKKLLAVLLCLSVTATMMAGFGSKSEEASQEAEGISSESVKAALEDENAVVLDARTQDAYAGWSTETNKLGTY